MVDSNLIGSIFIALLFLTPQKHLWLTKYLQSHTSRILGSVLEMRLCSPVMNLYTNTFFYTNLHHVRTHKHTFTRNQLMVDAFFFNNSILNLCMKSIFNYNINNVSLNITIVRA